LFLTVTTHTRAHAHTHTHTENFLRILATVLQSNVIYRYIERNLTACDLKVTKHVQNT